eukprot:SAG25_NODE_729_length_5691_cov_223.244234_4_plen_65_part_00
MCIYLYTARPPRLHLEMAKESRTTPTLPGMFVSTARNSTRTVAAARLPWVRTLIAVGVVAVIRT